MVGFGIRQQYPASRRLTFQPLGDLGAELVALDCDPHFSSRTSFFFLLLVVEEIDRVVFNVSALVIVLDDHSDVFVSGHALRLAVGESQA